MNNETAAAPSADLGDATQTAPVPQEQAQSDQGQAAQPQPDQAQQSQDQASDGQGAALGAQQTDAPDEEPPQLNETVQRSFLGRFMEDVVDPLEEKVEDIFSHTYLTVEQKFATLVEHAEQIAEELGWKVSKPVINAAAAQVMVRHMVANGHDAVISAPPASNG